MLARFYTFGAHLAVVGVLGAITIGTSVVAWVTPGRSGAEGLTIGVVAVLCLLGIAAATALYGRAEQRRSERFHAALNAPVEPSRLTVWTPPPTDD